MIVLGIVLLVVGFFCFSISILTLGLFWGSPSPPGRARGAPRSTGELWSR